MRDELPPQAPPPTSRPRHPLARLRTWRGLRQRDRFSAELAAGHGAIGVVHEASMLVELGWAAGRGCTVCARDRRAHGGATGSRLCVVGALHLAANGDPTAAGRAVDLVWQQLHRGRPRRTVHWSPPALRHAQQVQDLRAWNDDPARSAAQASALVRATLRTARSDLDRTRVAAGARTPADA